MADEIGWHKLLNARKWHYFGSDGRALCGNWLVLGRPFGEQGNDDSPDNCAACRRKLAARKTQKSKPRWHGDLQAKGMV